MVLYDAQSSLDFTTTNSFTHTPVGIPRGVLVLIAQKATASDLISGVTYGGVTMTRVPTNGFAVDTLTEPGACYAYFLGSGIPTGAQSVAVTVSSGTDEKTAWCMSVTGSARTEVCASDKDQENQANPTATLATVPGFQGIVAAGFFSGFGSLGSIAAGSGFTLFTNQRTFTGGAQVAVAEWAQETGENVVINFVCASDDLAICYVAIREVTLPTTFNNFQHVKADSGMWVTEKTR